jgi:hypothetical protein
MYVPPILVFGLVAFCMLAMLGLIVAGGYWFKHLDRKSKQKATSTVSDDDVESH